jgi:putative GTP pyrophosphokinase
VREHLSVQYQNRLHLLKALAATLEKETRESLSGFAHIDRIYFRVKEVDSFVGKALDPSTEPPYADPLVEIEDQVAGRILTFFLQDLDPVKDQLRQTFNPVEIKHHRPQKDEEFGYESHHLIFVIPPHLKPADWDNEQDMPSTFEIQVRTLFMHAWSEPQHDLAYKGSSDLPSDIRRELFWVAASAWGADQALGRVHDWQREHGGLDTS